MSAQEDSNCCVLSVVVPVYNRAAQLEACVASLCLSPVGVEVVVVDDGSEPDERRRVAAIADRYGVRLLLRDHAGVSAARNAGLAVATGRFVWFVDADDGVVSQHLGTLVDMLRTLDDADNVLLLGDYVSDGGAVPAAEECRKVVFPSMFATVSTACVNTVFPRATNHTLCVIRREWLVADATLRYPEENVILEDTRFALNVIKRAGCVVDCPGLRIYRLRSRGVSTTSGAWSAARSALFINDVCGFFAFLREYADSGDDAAGTLRDLYGCFRFVYLRTLAVKGCPWRDIELLRSSVAMDRPYVWAERILFNPLAHRGMALCCRLIRRRR